MAHGCTFNMTPSGYCDSNGAPGEPKMTVGETTIPFIFDGRKIMQYIRKPTEEEIKSMVPLEITAPIPYNPDSSTFLVQNRKRVSEALSKVPLEKWRDRLALAPDEIIYKILDERSQSDIFSQDFHSSNIGDWMKRSIWTHSIQMLHQPNDIYVHKSSLERRVDIGKYIQ